MIPPATSVAVVAGTIPSRTPDPLRLRSQMIVSRRDGRTCSGHLRVRYAIPLLVASVLGIAAAADATDVPPTYAEAQRVASPLPWRTDWWTIFGSPELDALVTRGNIDNADIAIIAARLSIARAAVRTASAERLPRVSAIAGVTDQSGNLATASGENGRLFELGLRAAWEPDLFGGLGNAARAARLDARAAEATLAGARLAVQAEIAQTYFALRALDGERDVLASAIDRAARALAIVAAQAARGNAAARDVNRRQVELAMLRADLLARDRDRALTRHALALLVGAAAIPDRHAAPELLTVPTIPAGLPSEMLLRRPDVAAVADAVEAARLRHRAAKTAWFPGFALTGNGGQASPTLGELLSQTAQTFGFNLILSLPIFDGGRTAARVRRAAAEEELAQAQQRDTILRAFRDVEDQLAATRLLAAEEAVAREAADASLRGEQLAARRLARGSISLLESLDTARTDLGAQTRLVRLHHARAIATVGLVRALGGGWRTTSSPPSTLTPAGQ